MIFRNKIIALLFLLSLSFGVSASAPFNSLEEFIAWEKNLKLNARFHSNYKTPDYIRVALMDSGPENAYFRYLFFTDNPQYINDYAAIHSGQLSSFPTDNSTVRKSNLDNMPPEIAEYYRKNPAELLAAEGFGHDPVLARKLYTGEISLPYGVNHSTWLRSHAWTPNGIIEKNNVLDYANADFSGGYNLRKIDPATGKPVEPTGGGSGSGTGTGSGGSSEQLKGHIELLKRHQKDMEVLAGKIKVVRESIALSLQTSSKGEEQLNCSQDQSEERYKGRCKEMLALIKSYNEFDSNSTKLYELIKSLDSSFTYKNVYSSAVASTIVKKGSGDIFAADKEAQDCPSPNQSGWKCLKTDIKTSEGKSYKILLKWNRPMQRSKGTIFYGSGGHGGTDVLEDASQRMIFNQIAEQNEIRTISLEMLDKDSTFELGGGYWIHGGGYETLSQIFMAVWKEVLNRKIVHGDFTNYYGGSNGTMLLASAMAKYNADVYFDRVLFMIGPFLPSLASACDKNSPSSFYLNNKEQFDWITKLLSHWNYRDQSKNACANLGVEDRTSILKNGKKDYPNTIIHVVVGAKEDTVGFGPWFNASNLEWYNSITAKSKTRLIRPNLGHDNSYEDMLRILKLSPSETPDPGLEQCQTGQKEVNGSNVEYSCGCNGMEGGVLQPDGCFHKPLN